MAGEFNVSNMVVTVALNGTGIGMSATLRDGSKVDLWLSRAQFEGLLSMYQSAARDLGVAWPKPLPTN